MGALANKFHVICKYWKYLLCARAMLARLTRFRRRALKYAWVPGVCVCVRALAYARSEQGCMCVSVCVVRSAIAQRLFFHQLIITWVKRAAKVNEAAATRRTCIYIYAYRVERCVYTQRTLTIAWWHLHREQMRGLVRGGEWVRCTVCEWVCVGKCSECLKARSPPRSLADLKTHPQVETPKHPTYILTLLFVSVCMWSARSVTILICATEICVVTLSRARILQ